MIYRPMYVNRIMRYTDTPFVKILTGIRRCGKSTILLMIMDNLRERGIPEERIVSYRFDSMEYEDMTSKQMYTELVVPQIKRNSILHIIRDCFCDVSMNNSRLFDADSALYFI